jgi:Glycosyl transferase family group 2
VGQLQRNEYTRYQRYISRRRGKVFVLTGTASLFRTYALKAVADSRGSLIPGNPGHVYDTLAMTEDNEMTLALKSLGAKMISPMQCRVITELMPTFSALWRQRMRWQRGALENIGAYGLTRATLRYWLQQLGIGYGTLALNAYLLLMLITLLAADGFQLVWFWAGGGERLRSRSSSRSRTTSCSRPSTSSPSSIFPPGALPAGTTSRERRFTSDDLRRNCLLIRIAQIRMVPGARRLRRDQHARVCRIEPGQTDSTETRVSCRKVARLVAAVG